jgi:hypothetical protein
MSVARRNQPRFRHEIEIVRETEVVAATRSLFENLFDLLEKGDRDDAFDAATIERKNPLRTRSKKVLLQSHWHETSREDASVATYWHLRRRICQFAHALLTSR